MESPAANGIPISAVISLIALLFGGGVLNQLRYKNRKRAEIKHFQDVIAEYKKNLEDAHLSAKSHQLYNIATTYLASIDVVDGKMKNCGNQKKRLEELMEDELTSKNFTVMHMEWRQAIFTDAGLARSKTTKKSKAEECKMDECYEKLIKFLDVIKVDSDKGKIKIKKISH